jgi:WD40 repeat protein
MQRLAVVRSDAMAKKGMATRRAAVKRKGKKKAAARAKLAKKAAAVHVPAKGAILAAIGRAGWVQFAASGRALLVARGMGKGKSGAKSKTLTLWDLESGMETPPLAALSTFTAAALSADNRFVAMGTSTGILAVQSSQTGKVVWKTKAGGPAIGEIVFSLDGSLVIAAAEHPEKDDGKEDAWIRVHRVTDGVAEKGFDPVKGALCCHLALSPDGMYLAHSEMRSHSVLIWDLRSRQMGACIRLPVGRGQIRDLAFGITARQLFVAQEKQISGWNAENGTRLVTMEAEGDAAGFESVAVIQQGGAVTSTRITEGRSYLEIWGSESARLRKTVNLPAEKSGDQGQLAVSTDGGMLALPGKKECWVWKVEKLVA